MRKREALGEQHRRAQGQSKEHRRQVCLSIIHDDFLVAAAGPAETLMQLPLGEVTLQWATERMAEGGPVLFGGTYRMLPWGHPEADRRYLDKMAVSPRRVSKSGEGYGQE